MDKIVLGDSNMAVTVRSTPLTAAIAHSMPAQFKNAGIDLAGSMPSGVPGPVTPQFPVSTLQADVLALFTQAITVTLIGERHIYMGLLLANCCHPIPQ